MQELKKRQEASKSEKGTEEFASQYSRVDNEMRNVEQEIQLIKQQIADMKSETTRL